MKNTTYEWYTKDGWKIMRDNKAIIKKCWLVTSISAIVLTLVFAICKVWRLLDAEGASDEIMLLALFTTGGITIIMGIVSLVMTVARNVSPIQAFSKLSTIAFITSVITLIICLIFVGMSEGLDGIIFAFPMFAAIYGALPIAFISFIIAICLKEQQKRREKIGKERTGEGVTLDENATYEWYLKDGEKEIRDNEEVVKKYSFAIIIEFGVAFSLFILNQLRATDELSSLIITCFYAVLGIGISTVIAMFIITRTREVGLIQTLSTFSTTVFILSIAILIGCPMFSNWFLGTRAYLYPMFAVFFVMLPIVVISSSAERYLEIQQKRRKRIYDETHQNEQEGENTSENI